MGQVNHAILLGVLANSGHPHSAMKTAFFQPIHESGVSKQNTGSHFVFLDLFRFNTLKFIL